MKFHHNQRSFSSPQSLNGSFELIRSLYPLTSIFSICVCLYFSASPSLSLSFSLCLCLCFSLSPCVCVCVCVCARARACARLVTSVMSNSATPWTVADQTPLSVGFSRQEYRSGLTFPPPGNLPDPGASPCLLSLLHCQADS